MAGTNSMKETLGQLPLNLLHLACFLLAFTPTLADATSWYWPFPAKRFTRNSMIDTGTLGLDGDVRVVAFGDFNGDQSLDILSLGKDQQTLSIHTWSHADFEFKETGSFIHPRRILNVVPGDFTHSGKLDLLIMGDSASRSSQEIDMTLYPALVSGGFDTRNTINIPSSTLVQPVPIDVDGDMKIDLLGITPESNRQSSPLRLWQNIWNQTDPNTQLFDVISPDFNGQQCSQLANPHSNAIVDLNGDCLADLFLVCDEGGGQKSFQIWINNKDEGFGLAQHKALPSGTQTISFADVDRDGTIDMLFTTCPSVSPITGLGTDCYVNIAYNKQLSLCKFSTDSGVDKNGKRVCRPHYDLCTGDDGFEFDLTDSPNNDAFTRFSISSLFSKSKTTPPNPQLLVLDTSYTPPIPLPLKLGDANLEGFPDFLAIIGSQSSSDRIPKLVNSVECSASGAVGCTNGKGRRGWMEAQKGMDSLNNIKDARGVAFLDLDEDGTLDIMVQRTGDQGGGHVLFVQNNIYYDAFFLKAIVLNGACDDGWCYVANSSERYHTVDPSRQPFGVSYSGASYKYTVLDPSGHRSAAQIGQLPQTSYHALQTPYSFFGLGRTNNYIENLFVGTTVHLKDHFINMEGVIPNSKVVILPSAEEGQTWKRELFLRPGDWIPWVTLTVVVGTLVLAVIVLILHLNEKREDELERRKVSHHINFDAL